MTCVGGIAAMMAHRLAQPMTAINALAASSLKAAGDPTSNGARLAANLAKIDEESRRATEMIRGFSRFAHRVAPDIGAAEPKAAVAAALAGLAPDAVRHDIAVRVSTEEDLPRIAADPAVVAQIVAGLVRNAINALATSDGEKREIVVSGARTDDGMIEIAVADTGPGIDPTIAGAIFDPFDPERPDEWGVGLAVSRAIVEALGGRMNIKSSSDRGTVVAFVLPVSTQGGAGERRPG